MTGIVAGVIVTIALTLMVYERNDGSLGRVILGNLMTYFFIVGAIYAWIDLMRWAF